MSNLPIEAALMGLRATSELIQSLRVTLQELEDNFATPQDGSVMTELKRILLLRIAEIEADTDKSNPSDEPNGGFENESVVCLRLRSET